MTDLETLYNTYKYISVQKKRIYALIHTRISEFGRSRTVHTNSISKEISIKWLIF